ncbi:hypothetical protein [Neoroseomonas lacus]|uniref:Uncharacterized protein n=1 Tax=Neoroseomonas lacus TaxID=287609 RepID=A0A917KNH2_9PROT|nr:hypothetical protein [Neoroseomonas lacus]GGJ21879.1 hypothetical protein GCM10011320_31380 [Neoroseomonas lacus]
MSSMHYAAMDEEIVLAVLDFLKAVPFRQDAPFVAAPRDLQRALMLGGFLPAKQSATIHLTGRVMAAALMRVAHELRRRGVHVEQARRIPGCPLPSGSPPANAFRIWCDPDALLDVVWRSRPAPTVVPPEPDPVTIEPLGIDPPRRAGQRAAVVAD